MWQPPDSSTAEHLPLPHSSPSNPWELHEATTHQPRDLLLFELFNRTDLIHSFILQPDLLLIYFGEEGILALNSNQLKGRTSSFGCTVSSWHAVSQFNATAKHFKTLLLLPNITAHNCKLISCTQKIAFCKHTFKNQILARASITCRLATVTALLSRDAELRVSCTPGPAVLQVLLALVSEIEIWLILSFLKVFF